MGRGYTASRSKSGRPTLRGKRERSTSLHALRSQLEKSKQAAEAAADEETTLSKHVGSDASRSGSSTALRTVRVVRVKRPHTPSAAPPATSATPKTTSVKAEARKSTSAAPRTRSQSMVRGRIEALTAQLEDELEPSEDESETIGQPDVMTKYKTIGRIVDEVLDLLAVGCVVGATTKQLCEQGDAGLTSRLKSVFAKTKGEDGRRLSRGIAYPTNISVNEVLCNHAPFRAEEAVTLRGNDIVKIHLGCHLDGYPVSAARTVVVTPTVATKEEAEKAAAHHSTQKRPSSLLNASASNAIEAARVALTGMIHLLRPGTLNADITDFVARVGNSFGVQAVEGVLSNRTKRWVPDGMDCIIGRRVTVDVPQQDVAECEIGAPQVWTLDIAFTNHSTYRMTLSEQQTTLFRRTPADFGLDARVQHANEVLKEITDTHFCFPFHFKDLTNPLKAKMGIAVLVNKGVVDKLPALRTKGSQHITARFSATVAVTERRITVLCGAPPTQPLTMPDDELRPLPIPADVAKILAMPLELPATAKKEGTAQATKRARVEKTSNEEES